MSDPFEEAAGLAQQLMSGPCFMEPPEEVRRLAARGRVTDHELVLAQQWALYEFLSGLDDDWEPDARAKDADSLAAKLEQLKSTWS